MAEVLIAGTLVIALAGIVTPLTYRLQRVHADAAHYRMAVDELRNIADRLSAQPGAVDRLGNTETLSEALSETVKERLPEAKLGVSILQEDSLRRVELTLNWNRGAEAVAPKLVVWLPSDQPPSGEKSNADGKQESENGTSTDAPKEAEASL